jgi:hypothetical protein
MEDRFSQRVLVIGAGYWRVSDPSDKSTPQQVAAMVPKCTLERVRLVGGDGDRGFFDEAISGGSMAERDGFLDLLAFAQRCHRERVTWDGLPLTAVVCYHANRFSRATSIKTARYVDEFMEAGVFRLLTWERWYDFRKEEDRALFNIQQDFTNNRYLRDLSALLLRGKKAAALAGEFSGGGIPYGFDRVLVERGDGRRIVQRIPRGQRVKLVIPKDAKGQKLWKEYLSPIPEDDPDPARQLERQTALWIWEQFATRTWSYHGLAEYLNRQEVPSPEAAYRPDKECRWCPDTVKRILLNPIYAGVVRTGGSGKGKYHRLVQGEVSPVDPGTHRTYDNPGAIVAELPWEGLVSKEVGERVRARVQERKRTGTQYREGGYLLNGVLKCGHCGGPMYGGTLRPKRGTRQYEYRKYTCHSPTKQPGTCRHYSIAEKRIHKALVGKLLGHYLTPERLSRVRAKLLERAGDRHDRAPAQAERLRQQLHDLDGEIKQARRNLLRVTDDGALAEAQEELQEWVERRGKLQKSLAAAERAEGKAAAESRRQIDEAVRRLEGLRERLASLRDVADDPQAPGHKELGEVLRLIVSRVVLYFENQPQGKRPEFVMVKGVVKLRPLLSVSGSSAPA